MDTPNYSNWMNETYQTMWHAANNHARLTENDGYIKEQTPEDLMSQINIINEHKQVNVANIVGQLFDEMLKNDMTEEELYDLINCATKLKINYEQYHQEDDRPIINKLSEIISRLQNKMFIECEPKDTVNPQEAYAPPEPNQNSYWNIGAWVSSAGNAAWNIKETLTTKAADVASATANELRKTLVSDNHPWKQKKYELALKEWGVSFANLCQAAKKSGIKEDRRALESSPLRPQWKKLWACIEAPSTSNHRSDYYDALNTLRAMLESNEFKAGLEAKQKGEKFDPTVDRLLMLCQARYTGVQLASFCQELIDEVIKTGGGTPSHILSREDFEAVSNACISEMGARRTSVALDCLRGHLNLYFDPALQQNVPFVLGDIKLNNLESSSIKNVRFLRMGSPTIEDSSSRAARINPEFQAFLHSLAAQEKKHLYISLQSDIPRTFIKGDESARNHALKELQKTFSNFKVVILDQDSDFYKQKGQFSALDKDQFIQTFKERLFAENFGFYLPEDLKKNVNFVEGLKKLFEFTSLIAFKGSSASVEERQNFIEIFYALVGILATRCLEADSVNITCKDAIDRAMKTNSLLMQIVMMSQGVDHNPEEQHLHKAFTLAPAFMVKKQAIVHDRQIRLLQALNQLRTPANQELLKWMAPYLGIFSSLQVTKRKDQSFTAS